MSMIMHDIDNSLTKFENQDLVIVICKHSKFSRINEVFSMLIKELLSLLYLSKELRSY